MTGSSDASRRISAGERETPGFRIGLAALLAATLSACGGGRDGPAGGSGSVLKNGGATTDQAAASVPGAAGERGIDCAATGAQHGDGPDVIGVTVGMPAGQAFQKIACSDPAMDVHYKEIDGSESIRLPPLPNGQRPKYNIVAHRGGTTVHAYLIGLPGQERVISVNRTLRFERENAPAVAALVAQLEAKYGRLLRTPAIQDSYTAGAVRSAEGRAVTATDDPLFLRCMADGSLYSLTGECGLSVVVSIYPRSDNPELVDYFDVSILNGNYGQQQVEAFVAYARGADQQRRNAEVEAASGRRPTL